MNCLERNGSCEARDNVDGVDWPDIVDDNDNRNDSTSGVSGQGSKI